MLPRVEHIKQINRFHDLLESIDKKIELGKPADFDTTVSDERYTLLKQYFDLTSKVWPIVDDCIEKIKDELDTFERNNKI